MAFKGDGPEVTNLNANNLASGTVAVARGGTGLTSSGTNGNVLTSNGTAWVSQALPPSGGDYIMRTYTAPATWTKPTGLKAVKVTVVGGGGGSGGASTGFCAPPSNSGYGGGGGSSIRYIPAPSIPGPVSVTRGVGGTAGGQPAFSPGSGGTGGTSSFGAFISATGGSGGLGATSSSSAPGGGGAGSGGDINLSGGRAIVSGSQGASTNGTLLSIPNQAQGNPSRGGQLYGGGAVGTSLGSADPVGIAGAAGAAGIIIVEEFY